MPTLQQPKVGTKLRNQWKAFILMRLGHPMVKVEVTSGIIDLAIDEAVQRFSQWVPGGEVLSIFEATAGETIYDLVELIPDYIQVRDVIYSPSVTDNLLTSFLGGVTTDFSFGSNQISYFHGTYSTMVDYTLWSMYNEQYLRTIGREGTWSIIGQNLHIAPAPAQGVNVGIVYTSMLVDFEIRRDEWCKEWALSEVMMSLGRARSKYSSMPGPRGDVTLDGAELRTEAKELQAELRERLLEYIDPPQFETG